MEGKVKWFSEDKGFGFVVGNDGIERFFGVRDIKGADLPKNGSLVMFEPAEHSKRPKTTDVTIIGNVESRSDDRASCRSCGKKMVPRIITGPPLVHGQGSWTPVPKSSVCPFCGSVYKTFPPSPSEKLSVALLFAFFLLIIIFSITLF